MKKLLAILPFVAIAGVFTLGILSILTVDPAIAGRRSVKLSWANISTSSTQSVSLDKVNGWTADINMRNYTGTFALQRSYDGGSTYVTYTTAHIGKARFRYTEPVGDKPTHLRGVLTSTFATYTGDEGPFAHVTPGANVYISVDEDWR